MENKKALQIYHLQGFSSIGCDPAGVPILFRGIDFTDVFRVFKK